MGLLKPPFSQNDYPDLDIDFQKIFKKSKDYTKTNQNYQTGFPIFCTNSKQSGFISSDTLAHLGSTQAHMAGAKMEVAPILQKNKI